MKKFFLALVLVFCLVLSNLVSAKAQSDKSLYYLASFQDESSGALKEELLDDPQALQSSWGAMAFAASGYNPATVKKTDASPDLLAYALQDICQNPVLTDLERAALVASASGLDPENIDGCSLLDKINSFKDLTSGKIGTDTVSTVFGVLALRSAGKTVDEKTIDFILQNQQADGGWNSGWGTEANFTAQTIQALILSGVAKDSENILAAKDFLKSLQAETGGIKYDHSEWTTSPDAFSDAYTLQAIYALAENPTDSFWQKDGRTILDDLENLKNVDGSYSFSSDFGKMNPVWTTSTVLIALNQKPLAFRGEDLKIYSFFEESPTPTPFANATPAVVLTPSVDTQSSPEKDSEQTTAAITLKPKVLVKDILSSLPETTPSPTPTPQSSITASPAPTASVLGAQQEKNRSYDYLYYLTALLAGLLFSGFIFRKKKGASGRGAVKVFFFLFWFQLVILLPSLTFASGRAGALVFHSDGSTKKACVSFEADNISSFTLLQKAGFNPVLERGFLVELDNERARSAWDPSAANDYWSFWNLADESWQYSRAGVLSSSAKDGQVNGWQRGTSALKLPAIKFSDICPEIKEESNGGTAVSQDNPTTKPAATEDSSKQQKAPAESTASVSNQENSNIKDDGKIGEVKAGAVEKNQAGLLNNKTFKIFLIILCFLIGFSIPILIKILIKKQKKL